MKKSLILLTVLSFYFCASYAGSRDIFKIDEQKVYSELSELSELENYVTENKVTYSNLSASGSPLVANVVPSNGIMGMASFGEPPLGIPSFIWGFCLGIPGLAVVYFVAEDSDETKKALWGCVAGSAIYVVLYVIYVSWIVSTTNAWW